MINTSAMSNAPFCWLHLSDFHTGKDNYAQIQLFSHILDEVKKKKQQNVELDAVFITGDIANKGLLTEYETFDKEFIVPLVQLMGGDFMSKIFLIPGNHD